MRIGRGGLNQLGPPPKVPTNDGHCLPKRGKTMSIRDVEAVEAWRRKHSITDLRTDEEALLAQNLGLYAGHVATRIKAAKKKPLQELRETAELAAAEALRGCVKTLEFHMHTLMELGPVTGARSHLNIGKVHNVIYEMKNKCGVRFETAGFDPFAKRTMLDQDHLTSIRRRDD